MGLTGSYFTEIINNRRAACYLLAPTRRPIHGVVVQVALRTGCISMGTGPVPLTIQEMSAQSLRGTYIFDIQFPQTVKVQNSRSTVGGALVLGELEQNRSARRQGERRKGPACTWGVQNNLTGRVCAAYGERLGSGTLD